eukprot:8030393-Pyramimonas_sp.AAC.1
MVLVREVVVWVAAGLEDEMGEMEMGEMWRYVAARFTNGVPNGLAVKFPNARNRSPALTLINRVVERTWQQIGVLSNCTVLTQYSTVQLTSRKDSSSYVTAVH